MPTVAICNRRYVVNVSLAPADAARLNPEAACPAFHRPAPSPFSPKPGEQVAQNNVVAPGPKMRTAENIESDTPRSGLTKAAEPSPAWWNRMLSSIGRPFAK